MNEVHIIAPSVNSGTYSVRIPASVPSASAAAFCLVSSMFFRAFFAYGVFKAYFIKHGHTKMAFVSLPNYDIGVVQHRLKGFTDVLTQHGLSLDARHCFSVVSDADPEQISQTVDQIMRIRNEITAMFVTSDGLAASLISGLHRYGVRIPEDLSVIGFDNTTIGTQIYPPLTTIAQDLELKARLTVDILNSCLKNPDASAESHVLDVRLVERESVRMIK